MRYCQKCKRNKKDLLVNSKRFNVKGVEVFSYLCRACNTKRCKIYRSSTGGKNKAHSAVYRYGKKNKDKVHARLALNYHVKKGNVIKPTKCSCCRLKKKVEAHHSDYSKPLNVLWLCRSCHSDLHRQIDNR
jgi:hypothetical protein